MKKKFALYIYFSFVRFSTREILSLPSRQNKQMWKPTRLLFTIYMYCQEAMRTILAPPKRRGCLYVDMCADLFHYGHVRLLKSASEIANRRNTRLVVGVHSDETIESYKRSPVMSMNERIEVVSACKYVDNVIPNAPLHVTEEFLEENEVELVVHAHAAEDDDRYRKMYSVPDSLGKFLRLEYTDTISTTEIIKRCRT